MMRKPNNQSIRLRHYDHVATKRQGGAALLVILLIVIVAASSLLMANTDRSSLALRRLTLTHDAMAMAKTALIDYAVLNPDRADDRAHSLPCPDIDSTGGLDDGVAHRTDCGASGETVMGRLPWRTLGIDVAKDAAGNCLWYVVSGDFKDAASTPSKMLNTDSHGQLRVVEVGSGALLNGASPEDRPIAAILAPMQVVDGQNRSTTGTNGCDVASAAEYLDSDSASGVTNALLSGIAYEVDWLALSATMTAQHNDRIMTISKRDIAVRIQSRNDFESRLRSLGLAVAKCVANFAATQPGGITDKRLPWPAPMVMADYREDSNYDDMMSIDLVGRLGDIVDDSASQTSHSLLRIISDCDTSVVPELTARQITLWRNWKDHFFYAVAPSFAPDATVPSTCGNCLTVNSGPSPYAAIVLFAGTPFASLGQHRTAPPIDSDTKQVAANYLEGLNATNVAAGGSAINFESQAASSGFNDRLFCIDPTLNVTEC